MNTKRRQLSISADIPRHGADSPYVATTDPAQTRQANAGVTTPADALQEATETPIAQSAPATKAESTN